MDRIRETAPFGSGERITPWFRWASFRASSCETVATSGVSAARISVLAIRLSLRQVCSGQPLHPSVGS